MGVWGCESVEDGWVFWRRGREAEFVEDADETLESTIHGHDLADPGRSGGEVGEMGEGVEERESCVGVQR